MRSMDENDDAHIDFKEFALRFQLQIDAQKSQTPSEPNDKTGPATPEQQLQPNLTRQGECSATGGASGVNIKQDVGGDRMEVDGEQGQSAIANSSVVERVSNLLYQNRIQLKWCFRTLDIQQKGYILRGDFELG